jgi:glutathione S-transferase
MIELIQFPWSPFCIVQRKILEYSGVRYKLVNIPSTERSLVWRLSKHRYYQVPIIRDGKNVVFEVDETTQAVAKYLDDRLQLGLFPRELEGVQSILWRFIESEVEGFTFRLNDAHWEEFVPSSERMAYLRHKERRFGRGCLEQWKNESKELVEQLAARLLPFEEMLLYRPFLLEARPRFVDFDLFGMLGNFLYSGHYRIPAAHTQLKAWYDRMNSLKLPASAREKLHT